ncbi:MAG: hypothetical protein LLG06_15855 [Desulfobacteraceae bacterium]|nr:hypothetical protein [Desulfobacteraceae bacterium]
MKAKPRLLHVWTDPIDAERLVRKLAETSFDFEAKLVKTLPEFVSSLAREAFDIIIADSRSESAAPGTEDLTLEQIAAELAPGTPFVLLCGDRDADGAGRRSGSFRVPRRELVRLKELIPGLLRKGERPSAD